MKFIKYILAGISACVIGLNSIAILPHTEASSMETDLVTENQKIVSGTYDLLTYEIKLDGTINITSCSETAETVVVPKSIDGRTVTSIGDGAFYNCRLLKSIMISDSVTSIGFNAFELCKSLTSITIPNSVVSIGAETFYQCTSLTSITIPDSVTSIGEFAFFETPWLESKRAENSLVIINNILIDGYTEKGDVIIPDCVTNIGNGAFASCILLTSITIPDSVTSIGRFAFDECSSLKCVTIGNNVSSIDDYAFNNCTSLTSITLPSGVTSIGDLAFNGCTSLTSIGIPNSVNSIGLWAFDETPWLELKRAENSLVIVNNILIDGKTTEGYVIIPYGVTYIGDGSFENCELLTSITIPDSVTIIGEESFADCTSLTSITIPDSVISLDSNAFYGCTSLTSVNIPDSIINIGDYAFYGCTSLTNITIPYRVTSIGCNAFCDCESLTSISIYNCDCEIFDSFETIPKKITIYGYSGSTAERYAKNNGNKFLLLGAAPQIEKGDVNVDGKIDISDATMVLTIYAHSTAGIDISNYTEYQLRSADMDEDNKITINDATLILTYYAQTATSEEKNAYYSIYCTALNSVDQEIKAAYGNTKPLYYKYYLYDINKDGIYELIVHVGDTEAEASILLYSFNKNGETFDLGKINGGHTVLTEKNGGLYSNQCLMGYQRVDKIDMVGWHGEWSVTTETVLEKDNLVDYASYGTPLKGYDISDTSPIEALYPKEVLENKPYVNGYVKTYALSGRDGSKIRLYLNGDFDKVSIQIYNEEYTGETEYYEADDFEDYIELNFNPLAHPPSVVYVTPYSNSGVSGDMIKCDIPEKISGTIQTGSISYPAGNIKGQINCHGGTVAGFTTDYVVNGGAVGTVRNSLGNRWHVTAKNVCTNYGIKWYELWDSDDGDYYGWVDSNYIDFY